MLKRQLSQLNGHKLESAKLKRFMFSALGFALPYVAKIRGFLILHHFCLLPA
jgi:hypothetical protein